MAEVMHHPANGMLEEQSKSIVMDYKIITTQTSADSGVSDITDVSSEKADEKINGNSENSVYFDNNQGMWKCRHCTWTYKNESPLVHHIHQESFDHHNRGTSESSDSDKNLNVEDVIIDGQKGGTSPAEIVSDLSIPTLEKTSPKAINDTARSTADLEEESDEEVIEMEFERAVEKIHTHSAHCPNCNSQITKVVLRRKIRGTRLRSHVHNLHDEEPVGLFGCLSCFSIFVPSGNCLNSFSLFGNKGKNVSIPNVAETNAFDASIPASSGSINENVNNIEQGSAFDLFWNLGKGEGKEDAENSQDNETGKSDDHASSHHNHLVGTHHGSEARVPLSHGKPYERASNVTDGSKNPVQIPEVSPIFESLPASVVVLDIDEGIDSISRGPAPPPGREIDVQPSAKFRQPRVGEREFTRQGSKFWEILKCIVYGGLIELITSFGIVTSADSSGATKLNIIALGIANVISGLFVLGHNLKDLKNEESKYQEILGRREHLLLHAIVTILSYLLFGFMPPIAYGYTKFWIVAAASFACIFVLAIAKAYVNSTKTFVGYLKTISYYITMAVTVSGLAYVVGDQLKKLMEEGGWFDPNAAFPPPFAPDLSSTTLAWSSL